MRSTRRITTSDIHHQSEEGQSIDSWDTNAGRMLYSSLEINESGKCLFHFIINTILKNATGALQYRLESGHGVITLLTDFQGLELKGI